jgi:copper chaperone CopZ
MQIRILYFEGCPNHRPLVEMASRIVQRHGLDAEIEEVEVSADDVVRHRFLGSPTVQVDGVDIEPAARERSDFAMSCRVYGTPDRLPSEQMLLDALGVKTEPGCCASAPSSGMEIRDANRTGMLAAGGSVASAVLSSACCWLPLLLLAFGASAGGLAGVFESVRPYFLIAAVFFLGVGFYFAYFRKPACRPGDGCASPNPRVRAFSRRILWVATTLVVAFALFPYYSPALIRAFAKPATDAPVSSESDSPALTADRVTRDYSIDGMTCDACAATLEVKLAKLPGVAEVHVSYPNRRATIVSTVDKPDEATVRQAVEQAGYKMAGQQND